MSKPDITHQGTVFIGMAADVIGQRGGGGFTVTAGNGYHPAVADIPVSKFDLADHGYPFALISAS